MTKRLYDKEKKILNYIEEFTEVKRVLYFDLVDSTNNVAKEELKKSPCDTLIIANEQSAGRGRLGRTWISTKGEGLYMTLCKEISIQKDPSILSIIAGIALFETLDKFGVSDMVIKWPNDIMVNNKKVAGILSELISVGDCYYAIIGIGINLLNDSFDEDLASKATSLKLEGYKCDLDNIARNIVIFYEKAYNYIKRDWSLSPWQEFFQKNLLNINKKAIAVVGGKKLEGIILGINNNGSLRLLVSGEEISLRSGEVTLERLYC